jgi:hypothetical protein
MTSRCLAFYWRVVDVGASSYSIPDNGARKLVDDAVLNSARELVGV